MDGNTKDGMHVLRARNLAVVSFKDLAVEVQLVDGNLVVHALHTQANHDGRNMFTIQQDGTVVPFKGEE